MKTGPSEILKALENDSRFIVTAHVNPDGDSIGASLGLARRLRSAGKNVTVTMVDGIPPQFAFLGDGEPVTKSFPPDASGSTAVVVDTPELSRTGAPDGYLASASTLLNIDHHPSNTLFGDLNLVDVGASSASLLIHEMLHDSSLGIDPEAATMLYAGVLTDTGAFRFGNTDARTFRAAAELVDAGADAAAVASSVYGEQPVERLRLLGLVLSSLESELDGRVAVMVLTDEMRRVAGASGEEVEGLASYGHKLRGVEVSLLLREQGDGVRVSLRSGGEVDVNRIASSLGGGGHRAAAGVFMKGTIPDVRERLLAEVARSVARR